MTATLLLAEIDAEGGDADAWEARLAAVIPREAWPSGSRLGLLDDPIELGPDYSPTRALGPDFGWSALASPAFLERLLDKVGVRWVLVSPQQPSAAFDALLALVGERALLVSADDATDAAADLIADRVEAVYGGPADRFVLVGAGDSALRVARAMSRHPGLRDAVSAVLAVDGELGDAPEADAWMREYFTHDGMDRELVGATPWFAVRSPGRSALQGAWPSLAEDRGDLWGVDSVDLGVVACAEAPGVVARALATVVACWVLSRR